MTVLADTSVWVEYLRRGKASPAARLDDLLVTGEIVVCGPVVAEILAGAKTEDRNKLWLLLAGLPWANLGPMHWQSVGDVAGRLRERGEMTALTDIEIAVAAVESSSRVWTHDMDFRRIGGVLTALRFFEP